MPPTLLDQKLCGGTLGLHSKPALGQSVLSSRPLMESRLPVKSSLCSDLGKQGSLQASLYSKPSLLLPSKCGDGKERSVPQHVMCLGQTAGKEQGGHSKPTIGLKQRTGMVKHEGHITSTKKGKGSPISTTPNLMNSTPVLMKTPGLRSTAAGLTKATPELGSASYGLLNTSLEMTKVTSVLMDTTVTPQSHHAGPTVGVTTPCRYTTSVTTPALKNTHLGLENKLLMSPLSRLSSGLGLSGHKMTSLLAHTSGVDTASPVLSMGKNSPLGRSTDRKSELKTGSKALTSKLGKREQNPSHTSPTQKAGVQMKIANRRREKTEKISPSELDSKKPVTAGKTQTRMDTKAMNVPAPEYKHFGTMKEDDDVELPAFTSSSIPIPVQDTSSKKMALLNAVSSSLICSPNFKDNKDSSRCQLMALAENVALYDPEFVLKTALYTRRELNIRTPANFLLALASNIHSCRIFLKKYFKASIFLPSDWIEVAELYQAFYDKSINYGSLPAALRRVMTVKFPDFDKYQLAKYNKDKSKSKKVNLKKDKVNRRKKQKEDPESESSSDEDEENEPHTGTKQLFERVVSVGEESETEEELAQKTFTLKQLIRKLHITEPVEHVMCLIGKKYPESLEEFYKSRLPGTWEEERSGKRMKLPVPQTWETQVSMKGNKASTWEELIDNKKLPFMAMLRNLRNMIKAGISPKHHNWVIKKLSDEGAVIYSKQFPFRFFSAYEILDQLEKEYDKNQEEIIKQATLTASGKKALHEPKEKIKKSADGTVKWWLFKKNKKKTDNLSEVPFDTRLLGRYRKALDSAVKIATVYNVQPIKGRTLIFCDVSDQMNLPCTAARGLGKPRLLKEVGLLLGLMCKYSCEESTLILYNNFCFMAVDVDKGTILDNMNILKDLDLIEDKSAEREQSESGFPKSKLEEILRDRIQVDNLIILGTGIEEKSNKGSLLSEFLLKYRRIVYPDLLFVSVALAGRYPRVSGQTSHPNDIRVSGYSDQILRFIAERGSGAQLTHVENIATAYQLDSAMITPPEKLLTPKVTVRQPKPARPVITSPVPVWRTVRVFISSTFRDMHGERDILTRFIFPELRAMAKKHFINVVEVDLRWGVTEEDSKNKQAVEICLREVSKCQYFIGLLGERHGWVPLNSDLPDDPEFDWVKDHPQGASMTELEMYAGALRNPKEVKGQAFFYIRDNSFISNVPDRCRGDFETEHSVSRKRVETLKETVRQSGLCSHSSYPASWEGIVEDKPFTGSLAKFGWIVLNDLWRAIRRQYPDEEIAQDSEAYISKLHQAAMATHTSKFVGRKSMMKQCLSKMGDRQTGVLLLTGKPGSGKSAFVAALNEEYKSFVCEDPDSVFEHIVGAAPDSANLTATLRRLCWELQIRFSLPSSVPQEYKNLVPKFSELLKEAGKQSDGPVVMFIDGIDSMEESHQPYNMEWLPQPVPQNVLFVLTAVEGGRCHKILQKRAVKDVSVGALDLLDKAKVVRSTLALYRKSLDESAFNNQMKILLSKREASNPLYLNLACEELRLFSLFEKITPKLKSLPHTVSQLLGDILTRMETDVGRDLIRTSLCLLVISRNGLGETQLHHLLSLHQVTVKTDCTLEEVAKLQLQPTELLPAAIFLRVQRALQAFLRPMESVSQTFTLAHAGMEEAIRQRYLHQKSEETESQLHKLFSGYFWQIADPRGDASWQGTDGKAFSELTYHLMVGGYFDQLETVLCDLTFLEKKCRQGQITQLIEDFNVRESTRKVNLKNQKNFLEKKHVKEYQMFVSRHAHILSRHPGLTLQQALNDHPGSQPAVDAERILNRRPRHQKSGIVCWNNRPETTDQCVLTIDDLSTAVLCVAISPCEKILACGDADCNVKLYDIDTGKTLRTFHGHSNKLTDLCFVSQTRLVSSSKDKVLYLWDVESGERISTFKGHGRSVNSCTSNGTLVASAGWDCNLKIWSVKTGKHIWEFKDMRPLNCVSFHPEDECVVTGGWDTTLKIWDIFNRKRKAILRGHRSSVRDAAFSPSGRYLASAALDGEVKLWSALNGTQLGDIRGHSLPINKLLFSPSGKELITVSDDQKIKVWSGHLGKLLHHLEEDSPPSSVAFSPDGKTVAVGFHFGMVRVFDVESGLLNYEATPHADPVRSITYTLDGEKLITGSEDCTSKVLDSSTGEQRYTLSGHSKPVLSVTAGTALLASTSEDFTCCLFRYQTSYQLKTKKQYQIVSPVAVLTGHVGPVTSCSFNQYETKLATASRDMSVRIWDMTTIALDLIDREPITVLHACHADWVTDCKWSNIGEFLITSANDCNVKVWDMNSGKEKTSLVGHSSTINSVAYKYGCVVTSSSDGTAKVWSHKGTEITTLYGHKGRVIACDMHVTVTKETERKETELSWGDQVEEMEKQKKEKAPQVKFVDVVVVTCDDTGSVRLWKPLQANELACLTGHSDRVVSLACMKSGRICTASLDNSVKSWSVGVTSEDLIGRHNGEVTCVVPSWDEQIVATGSRDGCLKLWTREDTEKGKPMFRLSLSVQAHAKSLNAVCFMSDDKLATASDDATIRFWKIITRESDLCLRRLPLQLETNSPISTLTYHKQSFLVSGEWSGEMKVWHLDNDKLVRCNSSKEKSRHGHVDWVTSVKYHEKFPAYLFTVGADCKLGLWSMDAMIKDVSATFPECRLMKAIESSGKACLMDIDVCGTNCFVGDSEGRLSRFTVSPHPHCLPMTADLVNTEKVHDGSISAVLVTEKYVFSASYDSTIKIWTLDFKQVGQFCCPSPVTCLRSSSTSRQKGGDNPAIICGDKLGNVYFLSWTM